VALWRGLVNTTTAQAAPATPRHARHDSAFIQDRAPADWSSSAGWRTGPPQTGLRLRGGGKSTVPAQRSRCADETRRVSDGWLQSRARRRGPTFFETEAESLDPVLRQSPTDRHAFVRMNPIAQLGDGDVSLRFDQCQHMGAHLVRNTRSNAETRLNQTPSMSISNQLLAHLPHILPTDAKTARENAATTFAALIGFQDPDPQIVRICSSHRSHVAVTSPENLSINHKCAFWVYLS